MKEVELKLVANNSTAVQSVRQLATESEKLYTNNEKQQKRQVGLIADIEKELGKLQTAQKNAMSIEQIEKYNRKIAEAKQNLQEYEQAGLKADKQTQSLSQSIGKWALSIGGAAAILGVLKDAVMKLTPAINAFNIVGAVTSQVLNNIVSGNLNWIQGIQQAIKIQEKFNQLRYEGYQEGYKVQKLETEFQRKWSESLNEELTTKEKIAKIDEALAAHNKAIDLQMEHAIKTRNANLDVLQNGKFTEDNVKAFWDSMRVIEALDAERFNSTKRLTRQRSTLEQKDHNDSIKRWYDEIDAKSKADEEFDKELLDRQNKYQALALKLLDDYDKSNIESLTGVKKLEAQRDFGLKQIAEFRKQIAALGKVTEGQDKMFSEMAANVWKGFLKGMEKEAKLTPDQKSAISKALLSGMPSSNELQHNAIRTTPASKPVSSIWDLIGIDTETDEGKAQKEAIEKAVSTTIKALDDIYKAKVEDATRQRELAQTKVSDAEQALNTEVELYKAGYASNVAAKQKELEDLKKQRDIAAQNEEKAVRQQRALDTVVQLSSLITASADIFKSFAKIPIIGIPLAIGMIATMFGAFTIAKVRAANATKLAEGGRGEVSGRLHSQGGERFLDHVEIEQGEKWGVLSRSASRKYGNTFYRMVDSFNRDALSVHKQGVVNNILLDTSETNGRLDELIKLNKKENKEDIIHTNGMTIYKKGSTIRTIKH